MSGIFKSKIYGSAVVGERGQLVIPAELRKQLNIKSGDQLMVFAKTDKKVISLMPEKDFSRFLKKASDLLSRLESKVNKNKRA